MRKAILVGYARVSTTEQNGGRDAQERDLKAAGAAKIYAEKVSSVARGDKLAECLRFLREGDALLVTNLTAWRGTQPNCWKSSVASLSAASGLCCCPWVANGSTRET